MLRDGPTFHSAVLLDRQDDGLSLRLLGATTAICRASASSFHRSGRHFERRLCHVQITERIEIFQPITELSGVDLTRLVLSVASDRVQVPLSPDLILAPNLLYLSVYYFSGLQVAVVSSCVPIKSV